jgi:hypothetical protein
VELTADALDRTVAMRRSYVWLGSKRGFPAPLQYVTLPKCWLARDTL